MNFVAGIDPGLNAAVAIYDQEKQRLVAVYDIPTIEKEISGKKRKRLDMKQLRNLFEVVRLIWDVKLIGMEQVQGYGGKGQSASAAFSFGEAFGRIAAVAEACATVSYVTPAVWKLREKVPLTPKAIVELTERELLNDALVERGIFRGSKGGYLHDRAEAALLARYTARSLWPIVSAAGVVEGSATVAASEPVDKPAADPPAPVAKPKRKARKAK